MMLYLHRFGEVVDIKPISYCTTRSKNCNQLVINCWRYLALVRKVESTLQHSRKGCARHTQQINRDESCSGITMGLIHNYVIQCMRVRLGGIAKQVLPFFHECVFHFYILATNIRL